MKKFLFFSFVVVTLAPAMLFAAPQNKPIDDVVVYTTLETVR